MARVIVGATGASGLILTKRIIQTLNDLGHDIEFVMTPHACHTAALELGKEMASPQKFIQGLPRVTLHSAQDISASICSGTYPTDGMVVIPCSMATLAAISCGLADNTLRRAADVILKERRKLIIVPRETPLSEIHLENMLRLTRMGAVILPPVPAWYLHPTSLQNVEEFIVGRVLDHLNITHTLYEGWDAS